MSYTKKEILIALIVATFLAVYGSAQRPDRASKFDHLFDTKKRDVNLLLPLMPGGLDPTFGTSGKVISDLSSSEIAYASALQADGKIVAAGRVENGASTDFAVLRYSLDGSLDATFGGGDGKVTTNINGADVATALAVQTDGKIIAVGIANNNVDNNFTLVRYNTDGSLDSTFGSGGIVVTPLDYSSLYDVAIQADGKIVVAGHSYEAFGAEQLFTVGRYNPDGTLDVTFGNNGLIGTSFGGKYEAATTVMIQTDGKIVAVGTQSFILGYSNIIAARYNSNGTLDTSFDSDGRVITTFNGYGDARSAALQADGKIVVAGAGGPCELFDCGPSDFQLVRYNSNGSLDTSFDGDGKVRTDFAGSNDTAYGVGIQSNGNIIVSGYASTPEADFGLASYKADGSLDTSFDGDGKLTTDFDGRLDFGFDLALEPDGDIVTVGGGRRVIEFNSDFQLARYRPSGILDTTFGAAGKVSTSLINPRSQANAVATLFDGSIIVVGTSDNGTLINDFAAASYDRSGHLARYVTTDFTNTQDVANAIAIQPDGKIVVAGYSGSGPAQGFALVRYNADLTLDMTFGNGGKVVTDFGLYEEGANAVAVQLDGKIIAAGYSSLDNKFQYPLAIARYNADGTLDPTFDGDGKLVESEVQFGKSVLVQPDGKIVAGGYLFSPLRIFGTDFALIRYNADGSHDPSFGSVGIATTEFDYASYVTSIAYQADGRIVAVGTTATTNAELRRIALARYNTHGSPDTTFDADGKLTTTIGTQAYGQTVRIQRNGKIVAAGHALGETTNIDFAAVRYTPNGLLDATFDNDGIVTTDFNGTPDRGNAAALQTDGKIVVAGSTLAGARDAFALARYIGDTVRTPFDYDGDGRSDVSVFRPTGGQWFVLQSLTASTQTYLPNYPSNKIVPADYDGDGRTDVGQYDSASGTWHLLRSSHGHTSVRFGADGDIPVPADFDGDGKADVAIYRPSTGSWWINQTGGGGVVVHRFGLVEDKPVPGDYDRDGRADIAVYRPSEGIWYLLRSTEGFTAMRWGLAEDRPVVGDYDGDGRSDLALVRPSTNVWYVLKSSDGGFFAYQFGVSGDIPSAADFDGDGQYDIAVFRPSTGLWYILQTSNGQVRYQHFGLSGDLPTPSAFISE